MKINNYSFYMCLFLVAGSYGMQCPSRINLASSNNGDAAQAACPVQTRIVRRSGYQNQRPRQRCLELQQKAHRDELFLTTTFPLAEDICKVNEVLIEEASLDSFLEYIRTKTESNDSYALWRTHDIFAHYMRERDNEERLADLISTASGKMRTILIEKLQRTLNRTRKLEITLRDFAGLLAYDIRERSCKLFTALYQNQIAMKLKMRPAVLVEDTSDPVLRIRREIEALDKIPVAMHVRATFYIDLHAILQQDNRLLELLALRNVEERKVFYPIIAEIMDRKEKLIQDLVTHINQELIPLVKELLEADKVQQESFKVLDFSLNLSANHVLCHALHCAREEYLNKMALMMMSAYRCSQEIVKSHSLMVSGEIETIAEQLAFFYEALQGRIKIHEQWVNEMRSEVEKMDDQNVALTLKSLLMYISSSKLEADNYHIKVCQQRDASKRSARFAAAIKVEDEQKGFDKILKDLIKEVSSAAVKKSDVKDMLCSLEGICLERKDVFKKSDLQKLEALLKFATSKTQSTKKYSLLAQLIKTLAPLSR